MQTKFRFTNAAIKALPAQQCSGLIILDTVLGGTVATITRGVQ